MKKLIQEAQMLLGASDQGNPEEPGSGLAGSDVRALVRRLRQRYREREVKRATIEPTEPSEDPASASPNGPPPVTGWTGDR